MSPTAPSTGWVVDASVALKWFRPVEREPDGALARSAIGRLAMRTTSLAMHEIGNILTRRSNLSVEQIEAALALVLEICGEPLALIAEDHRSAAQLARTHDLTFYDASYVVIARRTGRRVLSADRDLIAPGLGASLAHALA